MHSCAALDPFWVAGDCCRQPANSKTIANAMTIADIFFIQTTDI
jgi:hypothetical protein